MLNFICIDKPVGDANKINLTKSQGSLVMVQLTHTRARRIPRSMRNSKRTDCVSVSITLLTVSIGVTSSRNNVYWLRVSWQSVDCTLVTSGDRNIYFAISVRI